MSVSTRCICTFIIVNRVAATRAKGPLSSTQMPRCTILITDCCLEPTDEKRSSGQDGGRVERVYSMQYINPASATLFSINLLLSICNYLIFLKNTSKKQLRFSVLVSVNISEYSVTKNLFLHCEEVNFSFLRR